jgi:glycosyltransferase involved in cell wall biosynthesis
MHIAQVIPSLIKGGAERVVIELSNSLVSEGHAVTLILAEEVDASLNLNQLRPEVNISYIAHKRRWKLSTYLRMPFWIWQNKETIKHFDVVHVHLTFGLVFGYLLNLLKRSSPQKWPALVATCHVVGMGISSFTRCLNERLSIQFDAFILMAIDSTWRNLIESKGQHNINVIRNGISISPTTFYKPQLNFTIGTISRLHKARQPELFLKLFLEIDKLSLSRVNFVLAGAGPELPRLLDLANSLGIADRLSFPGVVLDTGEVFSNLDVYISLNVEGNTGIAGLEAIAFGLPVMGIQLANDYKASEGDWIYSSQDLVELSNKIWFLLNNQSLFLPLTQAQHRVLEEEYSVTKMYSSYMEIYLNLTGKH